jgi:hypothetical protein
MGGSSPGVSQGVSLRVQPVRGSRELHKARSSVMGLYLVSAGRHSRKKSHSLAFRVQGTRGRAGSGGDARPLQLSHFPSGRLFAGTGGKNIDYRDLDILSRLQLPTFDDIVTNGSLKSKCELSL